MFEISQMAQVTEDRYKSNREQVIKRLNKTIQFATDCQISLKAPMLNLKELRVIGFTDASFANNFDCTTQLGHVIFVADNQGNAVAKNFRSYNSKRVVRSAMAGEVIAFSDMFDRAATLTMKLEALYGQKVPLQLLTDSKSLFDVVSKG